MMASWIGKLSNQKLCFNYWGYIVNTKNLLKFSPRLAELQDMS